MEISLQLAPCHLPGGLALAVPGSKPLEALGAENDLATVRLTSMSCPVEDGVVVDVSLVQARRDRLLQHGLEGPPTAELGTLQESLIRLGLPHLASLALWVG